MTRRGLKTYSRLHAEQARRIPSTYEIVSTDLLWSGTHGFAVRTPIADWYAHHRAGSALQLPDPDAFADPAGTTYRAWVERQREAAAFDDALFRRASTDADLSATWLETLRVGFAPLRYPCHAFAMLAAYVGSMAPSGRIAIAAAFQAGNATRRVHAFARRLALVRRTSPQLGDDARSIWETHPAWQPLRRVLERALVTWDWGEAFAASSLALAPSFDALVLVELAATARAHGDALLAELLASLHEDAVWERQWARALTAHAIERREENREVLQRWVDAWRPAADEAAAALASVLGVTPGARGAEHDAFLRACGLQDEGGS
jgi:toluene monooxygenase system protein E